MITGLVNARGESAVPAGIIDMSEGAENIVLPEELQKKIDKLSEELFDAKELKATYKLEIIFTEERSANRPYSGLIYALTNGGFAHGGGDEAVYFCTNKVEKNGEERTCLSPINLKWIGRDMVLCPECKKPLKPIDMLGQVYAKLPSQHWADLITRMFFALGCDADIRLGMFYGSIRAVAEQEQEEQLKGNKVNALRRKRHWVVYPLSSILKDTASGADLVGRIRSFLDA